MSGDEFLNLEVMPFLPDIFRKGEEIPADLSGAQIIAFGAAPPEAKIEGGGLIVDYVPAGATKITRVVFTFTELGMWPIFIGSR